MGVDRSQLVVRDGLSPAPRSPFLCLAALEEVAPVVGLDFDIEFLGGRLDALPRSGAFGIAYIFDLI